MRLDQRVAIRIPSQCGCGRILSPERHAESVKVASRLFAKAFGGCEASSVVGSYLMADGRLAEEPVTIVSAFCDADTLDRWAAEIRAFAVVLADSMNQEAVALEIYGALEFHKRSGEGSCIC